jgi:hypothetical protein
VEEKEVKEKTKGMMKEEKNERRRIKESLTI